MNQLSEQKIFSNNQTSNYQFFCLLFILFLVIFLAYSNHFDNAFQFDDEHTIQKNAAIQELNIAQFFLDGTTFSSLPSNQSYRPLITTLNAIDFKLGGGLNPRVFHIHIFITFLVTIGLLVFFVKSVLKSANFSGHHNYLSLSVGAVFGLLCANAETVNYIIQRAEIEAGLYILAGFVTFLQGGIWRKWHIYLIFPFIGFFAKEMAFTFAPLLFLYILIFEEDVNFLKLFRQKERRNFIKALKRAAPAFIFTIVFGVFYIQMLPETFSTGSSNRWAYLITQPFVLSHYILTFFVPYNLSADTDWGAFSSVSDYRVWVGVVIVFGLIYLAFRLSGSKETKMISFGILWFFISLLPTSSIIPLAEVLNDHRCFIPYMGLTLAVVFGVRYLLIRYFPNEIRQQSTKIFLVFMCFIFLTVNAFGVYQRNLVWKTHESLWKDVTIKSPGNGRGFMNYGLVLMGKGDYKNAEPMLLKAVELYPDYSLGYINLGILYNAMGNKELAQQNFIRSTQTSTTNHRAYFYYGRFLYRNGDEVEAKEQLQKALSIFPEFSDAQSLLEQINSGIGPDPQTLLNNSLQKFNEGKYEECIQLAQKALLKKPDYPEAYNNIGVANVRLGNYEEGIAAYKKALELRPDYQLVKNNLAEAILLSRRN